MEHNPVDGGGGISRASRHHRTGRYLNGRTREDRDRTRARSTEPRVQSLHQTYPGPHTSPGDTLPEIGSRFLTAQTVNANERPKSATLMGDEYRPSRPKSARGDAVRARYASSSSERPSDARAVIAKADALAKASEAKREGGQSQHSAGSNADRPQRPGTAFRDKSDPNKDVESKATLATVKEASDEERDSCDEGNDTSRKGKSPVLNSASATELSKDGSLLARRQGSAHRSPVMLSVNVDRGSPANTVDSPKHMPRGGTCRNLDKGGRRGSQTLVASGGGASLGKNRSVSFTKVVNAVEVVDPDREYFIEIDPLQEADLKGPRIGIMKKARSAPSVLKTWSSLAASKSTDDLKALDELVPDTQIYAEDDSKVILHNGTMDYPRLYKEDRAEYYAMKLAAKTAYRKERRAVEREFGRELKHQERNKLDSKKKVGVGSFTLYRSASHEKDGVLTPCVVGKRKIIKEVEVTSLGHTRKVVDYGVKFFTNLKKELELRRQLKGPHFAQLLSDKVFVTKEKIYIVEEHIEGYELFDVIVDHMATWREKIQNATIPEERTHYEEILSAALQDLFYQLVEAIEEMHRLGYSHLDLKPENIMVTKDGVVKVIDMGFAAHETDDEGLNQPKGSPNYAPPEAFRSQTLSQASDIFSMAMTMAAAAAGNTPYAVHRKVPCFKEQIIFAEVLRRLNARQQGRKDKHPIQKLELLNLCTSFLTEPVTKEARQSVRLVEAYMTNTRLTANDMQWLGAQYKAHRIFMFDWGSAGWHERVEKGMINETTAILTLIPFMPQILSKFCEVYGVPELMRELLVRMVDEKQERRATVGEVKAHPYFKDRTVANKHPYALREILGTAPVAA